VQWQVKATLPVLVPNVLVINPELPAKTVQELIALLKASPDQHSYASSGNGKPLHLSGELFKKNGRGEHAAHPLQGSGPALNDVIGIPRFPVLTPRGQIRAPASEAGRVCFISFSSPAPGHPLYFGFPLAICPITPGRLRSD
jgi:hypothetical protein